MTKSTPIARALISVFDKSNLLQLATFLKEQNILMISTGGTARFLEQNNFCVTDIGSVGQFPEILDGRVKTLNPRIHAGILCDRSKTDHVDTLTQLDIPPIDLVVCNLYPFSQVATSHPDDLAKMIEHIDIGGPTMLRAAAKNHQHVVVLNNPYSYNNFIEHYKIHQGTTLDFRQDCAVQVFRETNQYDAYIEKTLIQKFSAPQTKSPSFSYTHCHSLRYGENPHQQASLYKDESILDTELNLSKVSPLQGKELSYNNFLDMQNAVWALRCLMENNTSATTGAVVIKHGIPCGAALSNNQSESLKMAIKKKKKSAFGGIIALSNSCDEHSAHLITAGFFEVVIAKEFSDTALNILTKKPQLRLVALKNILSAKLPHFATRSIFGGALVQDYDSAQINKETWSIVTRKQPSDVDMAAMEFAFRMVIPTPSNAITIASSCKLLGVGAGQPNRVQSTKLAIEGAKERDFCLEHAALASDAFFPFDDSIRYAAQHGIKLIIQPGGSIKDKDVIKTADELGLCMLFTHQRHFKH